MSQSTETPQAEAPRVRRYRIIEGRHVEGQPGHLKQYGVGCESDIVETHQDLLKLNTRRSRKVELLDDAGTQAYAAKPARDDFDNMDKSALLKFIEEENEGRPESQQLKIDVKAPKKDIVAALRAYVPPRGV